MVVENVKCDRIQCSTYSMYVHLSMNEFVIYIIERGSKNNFLYFPNCIHSIIYVCESLNGILSNAFVVAFNQSYENNINNSNVNIYFYKYMLLKTIGLHLH